MIQQAVPPLLINNRVFTVRSYIVIVSADPWIVYYRSGYALVNHYPFVDDRTCDVEGECGDEKKMLQKYITNISFHKDKLSVPLSEVWWDMKKLKSKMVTDLNVTPTDAEKWDNSLKQLAGITADILAENFSPGKGHWIILSMDTMTDENWDPKILEVNTNSFFRNGKTLGGSEYLNFTEKLLEELLHVVYVHFWEIPTGEPFVYNSEDWTLVLDERDKKNATRFHESPCYQKN